MVQESRRDRLARDVHVNVLVAANRFTDDLERLCRQEGISHAQYVALWVLCLADGAEHGLPMGSVSDGLLNRAADTTRLVDRLEAARLAERLPNPADRRGVLVRATPEGQELFGRLTPSIRAYHQQQWAALDDDELRTLHVLLARALWGEPQESVATTAVGT